MTYTQIRLIKGFLAVALAGFGSFVGYQLFVSVSKTTLPADVQPSEERVEPITREVEFTQLDTEGRRPFVLRAAESVGSSDETQTFRDVEIHLKAGKEQIPLVITADLCRLDTKSSSAHLEGNVVIRDEKSLRIETSVLDIRRRPDRARSKAPVRFHRDGVAGTAGGLIYEISSARFHLVDGVTVAIQRKGLAPLLIESESAFLRRRESFIRFVDDVVAQQENERLYCNDLQVYLTEDSSEVEHIEAYGKVALVWDVAGVTEAPRTTPATVESSAGPAKSESPFEEPGTKRLLTEQLEAFFRQDGRRTLERARAREGGKLVLEPTSESAFVKELEGHLLAFDFDSQGRLVRLRGRGGVSLTLTPGKDAEKNTRRVTARQLQGTFDPETGELVEARCLHAVRFSQGAVQAEADEGVYEAEGELLTLTKSPRLWDAERSLEATLIRIDLATGDLEALEKVRTTIGGADGALQHGVFPASGQQPVHFIANRLDYHRAGDLAVYTGSARAFQGVNRVEAERIHLCQQEGKLEAWERVRTVLLQTPQGQADSEGRPTVTRAERLLYLSDEEVLHYQQGVEMKSDQMILRGERVDVELEPSSGDVKTIEAEGEVEIETQEGRAGGSHAKYLPESEEVQVRGDKAWLRDGDKLTEGKELTFFLTDDRILVDGREQSRTKTTYTSKPRL